MNIYHINAVFSKTLKDVMRNKRVLLFFLMFPLMTYLFYYTIKDGREVFPIMFLPINILFCSMNMMASIISEEKEKGTLRSLIFASVRPIEYFIGNGLFVLIATLISCSLYLPMVELSGINYLFFYLFIAMSSICSMILGATVGISVKNQMSANGLCSPVTLVLGMLPTFGQINEKLYDISQLLYTSRFANTVAEILNDMELTLNYKIFLTYLCNFIVCALIFSLVYKKNKLDD